MKKIGTGTVIFAALTLTAMFLGWSSFHYLRGASESVVSPTETLAGGSSQAAHLAAIEKVRQSYANVNSVELEATVEISIDKSPTETVNGSGQFFYVADGSRYKYGSRISNNLAAEGLMRNLDVAFDGSKFYMLDHESKILSHQPQEEIRSPIALPNPFFQPLEFLSIDDDACINCRLRLQDIKTLPTRISDRLATTTEIRSDSNEYGVVSDVRMSGGQINGTSFNYIISLAGESKEKAGIGSIMRADNGLKRFTHSVFNDYRSVPGFNGKIPFSVEVAAHDETGRVNLVMTATITKLKINQPVTSQQLGFNAADYEKVWDSAKNEFVNE